MASPPPSWRQKLFLFLRSSLVGLAATASDLGSLSLMVRLLGWTPQEANIPSLLLGLVVIFVGNKYFAFQDRSRNLARQGGLFFLIELGAIGLNILLFHLLVAVPFFETYPEAARLLTTNITYLGFSYPLWCLFVFRYRGNDPALPSVSSSPPEGPPIPPTF